MFLIASRYWIGDSGSWDNTAHWSTSSGGSGGASVPTSSDNVYFDANSFSAAGQTVSQGISGIVCGRMDWSGINKSGIVFSFSVAYLHGDFIGSSYMSMSGAKTMYLSGSFSKIDCYLGHGIAFGAVYVNGDGVRIYNSNSFGELHVNNPTIYLQSGKTQTIGHLFAEGNTTYKILISSNTSGSPATISSSSNEITVNYCRIKDITATGTAQFYADNSSDAGGNSGWYFVANRPSLSDSGTCADSLAVQNAPMISETGAGADAVSILANLYVADGHEHTQPMAIGMGYVFDPSIDTGCGVDATTADIVANVFWQDIADTFSGVDSSLTIEGIATLFKYIADGHQTTQLVVGMGAIYDPTKDTGHGNDAATILASLAATSDTGHGADTARILASLTASDTGHGADFSSIAKAFWLIDSHNILQPLGVFIMRAGTKEDLVPPTRNNTDTIPGRHGDLDFGSEFEAKTWEFHVHINTTPSEKAALKRRLAAYLNPLLGEKPFVDSRDIEKTYYIKYAGNISLDNYVNALQFTIPFKASNPIAVGSFEQVQIGSGTITNDGTLPCPVTIEITGAVTNPSVTIGSYTLTYTGTLTSSDTLIIDTEALTCTLNGVNAIGNLSGLVKGITLQLGDTTVVAASAGTTTFRFRECWI